MIFVCELVSRRFLSDANLINFCCAIFDLESAFEAVQLLLSLVFAFVVDARALRDPFLAPYNTFAPDSV